jgi:aminoglycoside phosphotransferase family enzyme
MTSRGPKIYDNGKAPRTPATAEIFDPDPTTQEKVAWLRQHLGQGGPASEVELRETHMSWVLLAGDRAYKLKKPVRFPYLDFSTTLRRARFCLAELELNRRLAPDVYLDVVPLRLGKDGMSLEGSGRIVDWLVVMRRLVDGRTLEDAIREGRVAPRHVRALIDKLSGFYRHAKRVLANPIVRRRELERSLLDDCRVLLLPRLGLPAHLVRRIAAAQRHYLRHRKQQLDDRVRQRRIVDAHGDLRPEHIWLDDGIRIIDCLEFASGLRSLDPVDELAFLSLECERLGSGAVGQAIYRGTMRRLHDWPSSELFHFYRCHRGLLRARLAIAHLLEPNPRTPEKWPRRAREYLEIAVRDAARLEHQLRTRRGRPASDHHASDERSRPGGGRWKASRPCRQAVPWAAGTAGSSL